MHAGERECVAPLAHVIDSKLSDHTRHLRCILLKNKESVALFYAIEDSETRLRAATFRALRKMGIYINPY